MDKLDRLYSRAFDSGINITEGKFSKTKKAVCLGGEPYKNVIIDTPSISSRAEEVEILAEEMGHYETGALYVIQSTHNTPIALSNRRKYEAQAKRWAVKFCLSVSEIERAIHETLGDEYLAAEYCQVTVELFRKAVEYYQSTGVDFRYNPDCPV